MNAQTLRLAYSGIVVGYVLVISGVIVAREYWRERARVREVIDSTRERLESDVARIQAIAKESVAAEFSEPGETPDA